MEIISLIGSYITYNWLVIVDLINYYRRKFN